MASSRSQEIRVGVVTIIALVILIGGLIWGKGLAVGVHSHTIIIDFPSANGVEVGAPVTIFGVRKGSITALKVMPNGVRMTAEVERAIPLHEDAVARLEMLELMGGKKIEIVPGNAPGVLPDNAEIQGVIPGDITAILAAAGDMTVDAKLLLRRLDSTLATVNSIVGDPVLRGRINNTLANVEQTSVTANRLIAGNQAAINQTISNLHGLSVQLRSLVERTGAAVDTTVATARDVTLDARRTIGKVDHTVEEADSLVAALDRMVRDLKEGGGTASMLLYDKEFADELQKTVKGLRAYIEQIEKKGINLNVGLGRK